MSGYDEIKVPRILGDYTRTDPDDVVVSIEARMSDEILNLRHRVRELTEKVEDLTRLLAASDRDNAYLRGWKDAMTGGRHE